MGKAVERLAEELASLSDEEWARVVESRNAQPVIDAVDPVDGSGDDYASNNTGAADTVSDGSRGRP